MSAELSAESFRRCLNQGFRFKLGDELLDVELIQVSGLTGDTKREDRSPFSVLFRGPADWVFEQQIVSVENDTLGSHDIFLVPIGPDPDHQERGMLFEAVFT